MFGGALIFSHSLCHPWFKASGFQTGAIGHCYDPATSHNSLTMHEVAHSFEFSIMGDFGMWSVASLDSLVYLLGHGEVTRSQLQFELWAEGIGQHLMLRYPGVGVEKPASVPAPVQP